jgi:hypothetical protein
LDDVHKQVAAPAELKEAQKQEQGASYQHHVEVMIPEAQ